MQVSPFKLLLVFAVATIVSQSIDMQSVDAQERLFGNGRFLKRMFGEQSPQPAPQPKVPTPAQRPSQKTQPTSAGQAIRPKAKHKPRAIEPARSENTRESINRLPKSPAAENQNVEPTRSSNKATLGFGMLIKLRNEKLYVAQLDPKGNAAEAGVRVGDQLVAGGGIDFKSVVDYNGIGEILEDGDQLEFSMLRGGHEKEMMITYGTAPEEGILEGNLEPNEAGAETTRRRPIESPAVSQINTRANSSFLPTQQNVQTVPRSRGNSSSYRQTTGQPDSSQTIRDQQREIQRLRQQLEQLSGQGSISPAPSLQLPAAAKSVIGR